MIYLKTPRETAVLCLVVYKKLLAILFVGAVGSVGDAKHPLVSYRIKRLKGKLIGKRILCCCTTKE